MYYLLALASIYLVFLLASYEDRKARQAFAARLGALYRTRGEFWRLCAWARDARERGDAEAGARFAEQAEALLPGATGESSALRLDHPRLAGEIGWTAGLLDDELADMGRAVAWQELGEFDRWITGRGRQPVESVLKPAPRLDEDVIIQHVHMTVGILLGATTGLLAWLATYWGRHDATLAMMWFFILLGAAVLGHVAGAMRESLWTALLHGLRYRRWWAGPA